MGSQSARKQRQEERNWKPDAGETLTQTQATYLDLLQSRDCTVATGPAGTGKTYVACAFAGYEMHHKNVRRIVVARPTIGVAKTMGFLPGDIKRKMAPWARPLTEAFKQKMGAKKYQDAVNQGTIQIESLEHIRGLTFDDAFMIIDEAQNTTPAEMKALLTRIGDGTRVAICGDITQSDLHNGDSGLRWAQEAADRDMVPGVASVEFQSDDVVRSELCRMWGEAFETLEEEKRKAPDSVRGLRVLRAGELA